MARVVGIAGGMLDQWAPATAAPKEDCGIFYVDGFYWTPLAGPLQ